MTILGNLNMAFFLAGDWQHARRNPSLRRDPAIPAFQFNYAFASIFANFPGVIFL
jgi:hypothetical protein